MTACGHSRCLFGSLGHADPNGGSAMYLGDVPETKVIEIIRMLHVPI